MKALSKKFDRFLEHVLDEHIAKRKDGKDDAAKDMVDVLLDLADDPTLDVKLERHGVKAFTQVRTYYCYLIYVCLLHDPSFSRVHLRLKNIEIFFFLIGFYH